MNFYVYLLLSKINNRYYSYVGYTNDLKKRLILHNSSKGAKYTRGKKWVIIYKKRYKSKSDAMSEEFKLKKNRIKRNILKKSFIKK
jgi:putative endonuclease